MGLGVGTATVLGAMAEASAQSTALTLGSIKSSSIISENNAQQSVQTSKNEVTKGVGHAVETAGRT